MISPQPEVLFLPLQHQLRTGSSSLTFTLFGQSVKLSFFGHYFQQGMVYARKEPDQVLKQSVPASTTSQSSAHASHICPDDKLGKTLICSMRGWF